VFSLGGSIGYGVATIRGFPKCVGLFCKRALCLCRSLWQKSPTKTSLLCGIVLDTCCERWGAGVETQKNVRGEVGRWGRVPFNEPYAPSLSTIYDGA